jgi:triphosphoribosyl-dephospho-CoA synthase
VKAGADRIAEAFKAACRDELDAPKSGNVHVFADGHRMTAEDFLRSADAAAGPLSVPGARVGTRILGAVEATFAAVGTNTNLGIILLCAPLAAAAEDDVVDLRMALARVLDGLDQEDASLAFRAIVRASPAGLGRIPFNDVYAPAAVTLKRAMADARERDRIARQYVSGFSDIFELGLPLLEEARSQTADPKWATLRVYLAFLATLPDTHIVRKYGAPVAEAVRQAAAQFRHRLGAGKPSDALIAELLFWDSDLKASNINPGTSADLTVATLFAHRLRNVLPSSRNNG